MRAFLFALAAAAASGAHAQTQPAPITYKGVAISATQAEFHAKLPDFRCKGDECSFELSQCAGNSKAGALDVDRMVKCVERTSIGGAIVHGATAMFRQNKLVKITFQFSPEQASTLITSAVERYGKPTTLDETPAQTEGGRVLSNRSASWDVGGTYLRVAERSVWSDHGTAMLTSSEEWKREVALHGQQMGKKAKDF